MKTISNSLTLEDRRRMGGNPQINFRLPADWAAGLDASISEADDSATDLVKAWLRPLAAGHVMLERDEAGKVLSITGKDARGKLVTIRCDREPFVENAEPLTDAPKRGRPRKPPAK